MDGWMDGWIDRMIDRSELHIICNTFKVIQMSKMYSMQSKVDNRAEAVTK
jgi:hypothetical protein